MSTDLNDLRKRLNLRANEPKSNAPVARMAIVGSGNLISRLLSKPASWVRRHERFGCCVVAVMDVIDKDVPIDGLVTEISQGGLLFRPASSFIFDRRGSAVIVRFGDDEVKGSIVNVKSVGYGIRFDEELSPERVQQMLESFGLQPGSDAEAA